MSLCEDIFLLLACVYTSTWILKVHLLPKFALAHKMVMKGDV